MMDQSTVLDTKDHQIIEVLRTNPRITNKEIAERVGLAESTVAQRIRRMSAEGIMRVIAQKHLFTDGYLGMLFLFVGTSGRKVLSVGKEIGRVDSVFSVSRGVGSPDLFADARFRSIPHAHAVMQQIRSVPGVESLQAELCFRIHKFVSHLANLSAEVTWGRVENTSRDDALFELISSDGRQSNREIARQLDVSEETVRQRLSKLLGTGQLQFQVVRNPEMLGLGTLGLVRVAYRAKSIEETANRLANLDQAAFVGEITGMQSILAVFNTRDALQLGDLCDNEILGAKGVDSVNVQMLVVNIKHDYRFSVFDRLPEIPLRK
jgi:DNA-binding Lrp family transcriptional regulator